MRFAFYLNPQTRGPDDDHRVIDTTTELSIEADRRGFAAIHLTEHHFTGYNTFSDPFMFAAYLAPQVRQAYIGFSVAVPPLHHPLRFAEQCNILDQLTRGRAIIGVGTGGSPIEFAGFGRDPAERRELTEQVLDIAQRAWRHEYGAPPLEFETPHFKGRLDGRIAPSSYRKPHPLIARACVGDEGIVKSAERGWPIFTGRFSPERTGRQWRLYRETLEGAGHDARTVREALDWCAVLKMIYLAETDAEAERDIREPVDNYLREAYLANSADSVEAEVVRKEDGRVELLAGVSAQKRDELVARAMIVGSPDTVAARIAEYADVGVTQMMLWFYWGYNPPERVLRSFRLFVEEVMPRFTTGVDSLEAPSGVAARP